MSVVADWEKGTTVGEPDGPMRFEPSLDRQVPTFIDPRIDLIPPKALGYKRVDYHIPFELRGDFKFDDWPESYRDQFVEMPRITLEGFVLCKASPKAGGECANKAVNRTLYCRNHGGSLHPSDKKLSIRNVGPMDLSRIHNLDRTQMFMQGFLTVDDLDDDEVAGQFVRNNQGQPIKSRRLGKKFEQEIGKELHRRLNQYLREKTTRSLEVLFEIVDSDAVEPADRLKAIQMLTDRTMGKPADIVLHGDSKDAPYVGIIDAVQSGSREDYRKTVTSTRPSFADGFNAEALDVEEAEVFEYDDQGSGSPGESGVSNESGQRQNMESRIHSESLKNDTGPLDAVLAHVNASEEKRDNAQLAKDRIKKARNKRYAKRASGSLNDENVEFVITFHTIKGSKNRKMKITLAEDATPGQIDMAKRQRDAKIMPVPAKIGDTHG